MIQTDYWPKPISDRNYDWSATSEGYEPGDLVGYGRTEDAAVKNLLDQWEEEPA